MTMQREDNPMHTIPEAQGEDTCDMTLRAVAGRAHTYSKRQGFWERYDPQSVDAALVKLALIVSEVGEAIEAVRCGNEPNLAEELADIIVRVCEFAEARGIDIEEAVFTKMQMNEARPYMHGKLA